MILSSTLPSKTKPKLLPCTRGAVTVNTSSAGLTLAGSGVEPVGEGCYFSDLVPLSWLNH